MGDALVMAPSDQRFFFSLEYHNLLRKLIYLGFGITLAPSPQSLVSLTQGRAASFISGAQAAPLPPVFAERLVQEVLLRSRSGRRILADVTATTLEHTTEATVRSFLQRLEWQQNAPLRDRLAEEFQNLERQFGEYRTSHGRNAKLEAGEVLSREERIFLEALTERSLGGSAIENLLLQSRRFFEVPRSRSDLSRMRDEFLRGESPASGTPAVRESEIPTLPSEEIRLAGPNAELPDLSILEQRFRFKVVERFRLYTKFFQAFALSDAEARRLFGLGGKTFGEKDLIIVRKLNRLLDVLNEYTRMRLVVKSFAEERPHLYERLNSETVEQTRQYIEGILSDFDFLEARRLAAERLRMNGIVHEAEKRMLSVVTRCKQLGGGTLAGVRNRAEIDLVEDNLRTYQQSILRHEAALVRLHEREFLILSDIRTTTSSSHRTSLEMSLRELRRSKVREQADIDLWRQRERAEAEKLKKMYIDFVEAYDSLSLFVNLRRGRVNVEEVRAFDLSDAFVPAANEMAVWQDFYDRALYNSTHELVVNESRAFFRAQVGSTRKFVRDMNELTGKYFGKRFTESQLGQEFLEYNRGVATTVITRIAGFLGLTVPPSLGLSYADRLWAWMFTDSVTTDSSAPDSSGAPSVPGGTAPGPRTDAAPEGPPRRGPRGGGPIRVIESPSEGAGEAGPAPTPSERGR
jgi:hypothetical protein